MCILKGFGRQSIECIVPCEAGLWEVISPDIPSVVLARKVSTQRVRAACRCVAGILRHCGDLVLWRLRHALEAVPRSVSKGQARVSGQVRMIRCFAAAEG